MRITFIPTAVVLGLFAALAAPQASIAKCLPQPDLRAASSDGAVELRVEGVRKPQFTLTRNGAPLASGDLALRGHHGNAIVRDDGVFVLQDRYDGLTIYNADGSVRGHLVPDDVLTLREMRSRPGGWACHPDGEWARGPAAFEGDRLRVVTHSGRRILIDVATARVVEAEPDTVQAAIFFAPVALVVLLALGLGVGLAWWKLRPRPVSAPPPPPASA